MGAQDDEDDEDEDDGNDEDDGDDEDDSLWHCSGGLTYRGTHETGAAVMGLPEASPPDPICLLGLGGKAAWHEGGPTHVPGPSWPSVCALLTICSRIEARRCAPWQSECRMGCGDEMG